MPYHKAARIGDSISHGGTIIEGSPDTLHNSTKRKFARVGDKVNCTLHGVQTITTGSPDVQINKKAFARVTSLCSCGATITTGADDVMVT